MVNVLKVNATAEPDSLVRIARFELALQIAIVEATVKTLHVFAHKDGLDLTVLCALALPNAPETDIATTEPAFASQDSLEFTAPCQHAHHHALVMVNVLQMELK